MNLPEDFCDGEHFREGCLDDSNGASQKSLCWPKLRGLWRWLDVATPTGEVGINFSLLGDMRNGLHFCCWSLRLNLPAFTD